MNIETAKKFDKMIELLEKILAELTKQRTQGEDLMLSGGFYKDSDTVSDDVGSVYGV